jgi:opacity protein-like surface antigen
MNNFETKILALAVASALAGVAHAEEYNWTGFKLGIGGGGGANVAKNKVQAGHDLGNAAVSPEEYNYGGYSGAPSHSTYYAGSSYPYSNFLGNTSYAADYSTENFLGQAGKTISDIGKSMAFGTIDFSLDKQVGKVVFGIVGNYDFAKKRKANTEVAGGQSIAWERNDYSYYSSSYVGGGGGYWTNSYSSNDYSSHVSEAYTAAHSSFQTQDSGALGLRLGFLPTDSTLVYATAGWTGIKIKQKTIYESHVAEGNYYGPDNWYNYSDTASNSSFKNGYFVGAGLQTKLTENSSFKLEYRYADYGKVHNRKNNDSVTINGSYGGYNNFHEFDSLSGISYIDQSTELQQHTVRAVISYDF